MLDLQMLMEEFDQLPDNEQEFDHIKNKLHPLKEIHGLMLLHKILPETEWVVAQSFYDVTILEFNPEKFAEKATEEQFFDLLRCGIWYSYEHEGFVIY